MTTTGTGANEALACSHSAPARGLIPREQVLRRAQDQTRQNQLHVRSLRQPRQADRSGCGSPPSSMPIRRSAGCSSSATRPDTGLVNLSSRSASSASSAAALSPRTSSPVRSRKVLSRPRESTSRPRRRPSIMAAPGLRHHLPTRRRPRTRSRLRARRTPVTARPRLLPRRGRRVRETGEGIAAAVRSARRTYATRSMPRACTFAKPGSSVTTPHPEPDGNPRYCQSR